MAYFSIAVTGLLFDDRQHSEQAYMRSYLDQFSRVYTCHDTHGLKAFNSIPFLPWMINANHGPSIWSAHRRDLNWLTTPNRPQKDKKLSVICSAQSWTPVHRLRFRFVSQLKEHFKDKLDWFGNGVQPIAEKWDGLAPYQFTIALENGNSTNLVTEKILDPFLTWTVPFYWGADNISDIFDTSGLIRINIRDVRGSINLIEEILDGSPYEGFLTSLQINRQIVLERLNFLNRIMAIVDEWHTPPTSPVWVSIARPQKLLSRRELAYQVALRRMTCINGAIKKLL